MLNRLSYRLNQVIIDQSSFFYSHLLHIQSLKLLWSLWHHRLLTTMRLYSTSTGLMDSPNSSSVQSLRPYFLILGLRIFFQNIKVGGGKKIKIKITKKFLLLFNLKHIWIGEKKNKIV